MAEPGDRAASPVLMRRMIETAIDRLHAVEDGARIEREPLRQLQHGRGRGVARWPCCLHVRSGRPAPGAVGAVRDVAQRRGRRAVSHRGQAGQRHGAEGRRPDHRGHPLRFRLPPTRPSCCKKGARVGLRARRDAEGRERHATRGCSSISSDHVEYFVEAAGVRSPAFTLKVVELPYVKKLDLEYRFPSYTGLEPRKVEDGGDIAVLGGTDVASPSRRRWRRKGGRVVIGEKRERPADRGRGRRHAHGRVHRQAGRLLPHRARRPSGERVTASPQYTIDILSDQTPTVTVSQARTRHRRDAGAGVRRRGARPTTTTP